MDPMAACRYRSSVVYGLTPLLGYCVLSRLKGDAKITRVLCAKSAGAEFAMHRYLVSVGRFGVTVASLVARTKLFYVESG